MTLDADILIWIEEKALLIKEMRNMEINRIDIDRNIAWAKDYLTLVCHGEGYNTQPYFEEFERRLK
jgi:hypothetical protein